MREDILEILDYCHLRGIVTCISTNGVLLDNELAKKLARMPLTYVQISIDGATPETNDRIRGEGSYARALHGVDCLTRQGLKNLSINTVVVRVNFKEIHELYRLARFYGAKTRLSRFRPAGRAREAWQEYHLTKQQILELSAYLSEYKDVLTGDSFFSITAEDRKYLGLNMCRCRQNDLLCCAGRQCLPLRVSSGRLFLRGERPGAAAGEIWRRADSFDLFKKYREGSLYGMPAL